MPTSRPAYPLILVPVRVRPWQAWPLSELRASLDLRRRPGFTRRQADPRSDPCARTTRFGHAANGSRYHAPGIRALIVGMLSPCLPTSDMVLLCYIVPFTHRTWLRRAQTWLCPRKNMSSISPPLFTNSRARWARWDSRRPWWHAWGADSSERSFRPSRSRSVSPSNHGAYSTTFSPESSLGTPASIHQRHDPETLR